jgi:hypothetical protein
MPSTNSNDMKTYLRVPCDLDEKTDGGCRYRPVSLLGCGRNSSVTSQEKCHHYNCMINIGLHEPADESPAF